MREYTIPGDNGAEPEECGISRVGINEKPGTHFDAVLILPEDFDFDGSQGFKVRAVVPNSDKPPLSPENGQSWYIPLTPGNREVSLTQFHHWKSSKGDRKVCPYKIPKRESTIPQAKQSSTLIDFSADTSDDVHSDKYLRCASACPDCFLCHARQIVVAARD